MLKISSFWGFHQIFRYERAVCSLLKSHHLGGKKRLYLNQNLTELKHRHHWGIRYHWKKLDDTYLGLFDKHGTHSTWFLTSSEQSDQKQVGSKNRGTWSGNHDHNKKVCIIPRRHMETHRDIEIECAGVCQSNKIVLSIWTFPDFQENMEESTRYKQFYLKIAE